MPSPLAVFRHALATAVVESQGLSLDQVDGLEQQMRVPDAGRGDIALPCFALAKQLKQNPADVARQVADALSKDDRWARVEAVGPYVNVTYKTGDLAGAVVPFARARGYGTSEAGRGKTVVIDFSSPNIAKPLAFHHLRSTVIARRSGACTRRTAGGSSASITSEIGESSSGSSRAAFSGMAIRSGVRTRSIWSRCTSRRTRRPTSPG